MLITIYRFHATNQICRHVVLHGIKESKYKKLKTDVILENKSKLCFNIICCLATILLLTFCIYIYCKNEDLCEISYRKFNQDSLSLYPFVTMCLLSPFKEEMLKNVKGGLNRSIYISFLVGNHWNESMLNISFDQVTYNLPDYIVSAMAYYNNQSE